MHRHRTSATEESVNTTDWLHARSNGEVSYAKTANAIFNAMHTVDKMTPITTAQRRECSDSFMMCRYTTPLLSWIFTVLVVWRSPSHSYLLQ